MQWALASVRLSLCMACAAAVRACQRNSHKPHTNSIRLRAARRQPGVHTQFGGLACWPYASLTITLRLTQCFLSSCTSAVVWAQRLVRACGARAPLRMPMRHHPAQAFVSPPAHATVSVIIIVFWLYVLRILDQQTRGLCPRSFPTQPGTFVVLRSYELGSCLSATASAREG